MFVGQAGLAECQKSQLWWDSNPQPLNGLIWQSRSPMCYPLRHRDHLHTRVGHVKVFLPGLCPSSSVRFARSVHRKDGSLGLCAIDARFKKATTLSGSPVRQRADRALPLGFEPRISSLQYRRFDQLRHGASLVWHVCMVCYPSKAAEGWFSKPLLRKCRCTRTHEWTTKGTAGNSNPGSPVY